jgi:hypothetical protein
MTFTEIFAELTIFVSRIKPWFQMVKILILSETFASLETRGLLLGFQMAKLNLNLGHPKHGHLPGLGNF